MILKKPYAFFIKQFKTIHLILSILISFLIYRITLLMAFFSEYLSSSTVTIDPTAHDKLFNVYLFMAPIVIIIISVIVLWVLFKKEKPYLFYVINIAVYIGIIVVLNHSSSVINDMIEQVVHIRTIRFARDLLLISTLFQMFTIIKAFVYATGFDIKKFNFGQDLAELEIEETDDEEFEFEISVDTNKAHRNLRRRARFSKYVYFENKFLINMGILLLIGVTFFIVYFNQNIYNKAYNEGSAFITSNFTMQVNRSFITKKNPKNEKVSRNGMSFVIVEIKLKKHNPQKIKLDVARTQLVVNKKIYYHKFGFNDLATDIGFNYSDSDITRDFAKHLLIYEVPDEYLTTENFQFKFLDTFGFSNGRWNPKYVKINLKPRELDNINKITSYKLGDELSFENSILGKTTLKIDEFKIDREHKLDYKFCVNASECYPSYEYVKQDIYNVVDKTLIYLKGSINWDNDLAIIPIIDIYQFINIFGTITYEIDGQVKQHTLDLKEIKPQKVRKVNDYYIEVVREVENADKIFITFDVRDMQYIYQLK
ncbi:MAG: hypothetical protein PHW32_01260 [Bacilli bacterium]|nr:hypothetical protein [Bacilli bacterium]